MDLDAPPTMEDPGKSLLEELEDDLAADSQSSESEDEIRQDERKHAKDHAKEMQKGLIKATTLEEEDIVIDDARWAELDSILTKIDQHIAVDGIYDNTNLDQDEGYELLAEANSFAVGITDYIASLLKSLRDVYGKRFPELETLVPDPLQYTMCAAVIGNGPMDKVKELAKSTDNMMNERLDQKLTRPMLLSVTVEANDTRGHPLGQRSLAQHNTYCSQIFKLNSAKKTIGAFVESRMRLFCPNLTNLLGPQTAAQLVVARGGLSKLCETPSSNIGSIGTARFDASGMATNVGTSSRGYLYHSYLVQSCRPEDRVKAMRIVSGKLLLAARVDLARQSQQGQAGQDYRDFCEKALDRLSEPPPSAKSRALPAPKEQQAKKRGGRRMRHLKEQTAMTEMRAAQNRVSFGEGEDLDVGVGSDDEGVLAGGNKGPKGSGAIRAAGIDERTRAKLSKKTQARLSAASANITASQVASGQRGALGANAKGMGLRTVGGATQHGGKTNGVTSLAFNADTGLSLADPYAEQRAREAKKAREAKSWFAKQPERKMSIEQEMGKFKKPALPLKRKAADHLRR